LGAWTFLIKGFIFAIKNMKNNLLILISLLFWASCRKDNSVVISLKEDFVQLSTHKLATYSVETNSKYLVVLEAGMGNDHSVWLYNDMIETIRKKMDVIIYDRAGYGKSTIDNNPRNIDRLRIELETVVDKFSNGRKVILIGHSLGGLIIRDYAIKNPSKTAALLFIDPTHENYNHLTQATEDETYDAFKTSYGENFGATKEIRELIEDLIYSSELPNLPNVPVIVLTSMKLDQTNTTSDQTYNKTRQDWYNAHELLGNGVTDFTHIQTVKSGHFIMVEEPNLVIDNFNLLLSKLP
jgi:pimeloyl-ACP methyl ester carboxylesterase